MPIRKGDLKTDAQKREGEIDGDERFSFIRDSSGEIARDSDGQPVQDNTVIGVSCDTKSAETWAEIFKHADIQTQLAPEKGEEIGMVIVQLIKPQARKGRWVVYAGPTPNKEVTNNLGLESELGNDVNIENITIINTGGPNTQYVHFPGCDKIRVPC